MHDLSKVPDAELVQELSRRHGKSIVDQNHETHVVVVKVSCRDHAQAKAAYQQGILFRDMFHADKPNPFQAGRHAR